MGINFTSFLRLFLILFQFDNLIMMADHEQEILCLGRILIHTDVDLEPRPPRTAVLIACVIIVIVK